MKTFPKLFTVKGNSVSKYQDVFDAIIKDDVEIVNSVLQNTDFMINAPFDYEDRECVGCEMAGPRVYLPFHLAIAFISPKVADLLLKKQVDVLAKDQNGRNMLHNIVLTGFLCPIFENDVCEMIEWLENKVSKDIMQSLLTQENLDGLRPLEFAAQQGALQVMTTILQLKGYTTSKFIKGGNIFRLHDVTEYEVGDRHGKSPVNMLAYLSIDRLKNKNVRTLLQNSVIKSWISGKMKSNIIPLTAWIVLRIAMIAMYMLIDNDTSYYYYIYGNDTVNHFCPDLLLFHPGLNFMRVATVILAVVCSIIFIIDITEFIKWRIQKHNINLTDFRGRKALVAQTLFYKITQSIFIVLVFTLYVYYIHLLLTDGSIPPFVFFFVNLARIFISIIMFWSLCYFGQLIPKIGSKLISLQRMLIDVGSFLIVLSMTTLFFIHAFQVFVHSNSNVGCIQEFSNPWETMYTLFRMMLNMYDTTSVDVQNMFFFQLLHMLYSLLVGIMALNFLIAIMSNSASTVAENEEFILIISRLSVVVVLEDRIYWLMRWWYRKLRKNGFYWSDGRCYVVSVSSRISDLLNDNE